MIITAEQFIDRVWKTHPFTSSPSMVRSERLWVFDRAWFFGTFCPFLAAMFASRKIKYLPGSGMCEVFSNIAMSESALCVIKALSELSEVERDVTTSMVEARVMIPKGESLNGIVDGAHSTTLVALTDDQVNFEVVFFEPQFRAGAKVNYAKYNSCSLEEASRRFVELRDCLL